MNDHQARKRFGQNFLHDAGVIQRILDSLVPTSSDHFVEIGPGQGAITRPLAERVARLDVVEIDRDLAADLTAQAWFEDVQLHVADALKFDFSALADQQPLRMVGNLPYNISTPLLFHLLTQHHLFADLHVMLQKEVVDRMTARPGSKSYGRLTVALAVRCEVQSLFNIGSGAFKPAPKVDSAFARLTPLREPLINADEAAGFDTVVREAFGQRRKQLGNALRNVLTTEQIHAAGIDSTQRAENLSPEDFVALTRKLSG